MKKLIKIYRWVKRLALFAAGAATALLAYRLQGKKKEVKFENDSNCIFSKKEEIENEGRSYINNMDDGEFYDLHTGVRNAGERGKERFRERVTGILHKRRSQ